MMVQKVGLAFVVLVSTIYLVGCQPQTNTPPSGNGGGEHNHGGHDHEVGPNGGHVLELGEEEYHAEWLHDETGKLTVIILDAAMKDDVFIESQEININTVVDGDPNPYVLKAINTNEEDPPKASRFDIVDPSLIAAIDHGEGATVTLQVEIAGTQYSADIEHHH